MFIRDGSMIWLVCIYSWEGLSHPLNLKHHIVWSRIACGGGGIVGLGAKIVGDVKLWAGSGIDSEQSRARYRIWYLQNQPVYQLIIMLVPFYNCSVSISSIFEHTHILSAVDFWGFHGSTWQMACRYQSSSRFPMWMNGNPPIESQHMADMAHGTT